MPDEKALPALSAHLDFFPTGGRSVAEVTRTITEHGERRILLRASHEGIDTATSTGRAVAAIMAALVEPELELGKERRAASRESRSTRRQYIDSNSRHTHRHRHCRDPGCGETSKRAKPIALRPL